MQSRRGLSLILNLLDQIKDIIFNLRIKANKINFHSSQNKLCKRYFYLLPLTLLDVFVSYFIPSNYLCHIVVTARRVGSF